MRFISISWRESMSSHASVTGCKTEVFRPFRARYDCESSQSETQLLMKQVMLYGGGAKWEVQP
eukprot:747120-Hanusia_phi.AAC.4